MILGIFIGLSIAALVAVPAYIWIVWKLLSGK